MRKKKIPYLFYLLIFHNCLLFSQAPDAIVTENSVDNKKVSEIFSDEISYEFCIEELNRLSPVEFIYNPDIGHGL